MWMKLENLLLDATRTILNLSRGLKYVARNSWFLVAFGFASFCFCVLAVCGMICHEWKAALGREVPAPDPSEGSCASSMM